MSKPPAFHLTRRAALDLRDIYDRSKREWREVAAKRYMSDLYFAMSKAAQNPNAGLPRKHRVAPFLMVAARQHFIVYQLIPQGIAILTIMHQVRDMESLIADLSNSFFQEVEKLKAENSTTPQKDKAKGKQSVRRR